MDNIISLDAIRRYRAGVKLRADALAWTEGERGNKEILRPTNAARDGYAQQLERDGSLATLQTRTGNRDGRSATSPSVQTKAPIILTPCTSFSLSSDNLAKLSSEAGKVNVFVGLFEGWR